jgi:hypothetical protein
MVQMANGTPVTRRSCCDPGQTGPSGFAVLSPAGMKLKKPSGFAIRDRVLDYMAGY